MGTDDSYNLGYNLYCVYYRHVPIIYLLYDRSSISLVAACAGM